MRTNVKSNSNFVYDTFTGSNDTAINSHTPDTGSGTWSQTNASSFYIQSNAIHPNRKTDGDLAVINSGVSDFTLSSDITSYRTGGNNGFAGLVFRYLNTSFFWYVFPDPNNDRIDMYEVVNGTHKLRVRYTTAGLTSGVSINLKIKCFGKNITLFLNSTELVTYVSNSLKNQTLVGIRYGGSIADAIWDNFTVSEFFGLALDWPIFTKYSGNPVLSLGAGGTWDDTDVNNPGIFWDPVNKIWQLYYSGYGANVTNVQDAGLASATFLTGPWTKNGSNPVQTSVGEDGIYAMNGSIIYFKGTFYHYYGSDGGTTIRCATSSNLTTWTKQGIVINVGSSGQFDESAVADAFARIREGGTTIELWYWGKTPGNVRKFGYATSTNGTTFTKYSGNPVITAQNWAPTSTIGFGEISVWVPPGKEGLQMLLTYDTVLASATGNRFQSQACTIDGGATWHYRVGSLLYNDASWESQEVFDSFIINQNDTLYLFYGGSDTVGGSLGKNIQIGIATAKMSNINNMILSQ